MKTIDSFWKKYEQWTFAAVFYDGEIQLPLYGIIWLHLMKITLDIYIGHLTLYNKHFNMCDIVQYWEHMTGLSTADVSMTSNASVNISSYTFCWYYKILSSFNDYYGSLHSITLGKCINHIDINKFTFLYFVLWRHWAVPEYWKVPCCTQFVRNLSLVKSGDFSPIYFEYSSQLFTP